MTFRPHNSSHHYSKSSHHHIHPTYFGVQLFSIALTGAFRNTENYLRDFNMHIGGHLRVGHVPESNNKDSSNSNSGSHRIHIERLHKLFPKWNHPEKREEVIVQDLSHDLIPIVGKTVFAILVHNLFTPEECANLIDLAESKGFDVATIHGPNGGEVLRSDVRKCGRCIIDDNDLAELWFERVMHVLDGKDIKEKFVTAPWTNLPVTAGQPKTNLRVVGINERLRILRYHVGEHFNKHQDNHYTRGEEYGERQGETSKLTFLLYLNEGMKGGQTRVGSSGRFVDVVPKTGSVLIFDQDIVHESISVSKGVKYACRTEFMYTDKVE